MTLSPLFQQTRKKRNKLYCLFFKKLFCEIDQFSSKPIIILQNLKAWSLQIKKFNMHQTGGQY